MALGLAACGGEPQVNSDVDLSAPAESTSASASASASGEEIEAPAGNPDEHTVAAIQERGTLVVTTEAGYAPFEFLDEEGNVVGLDASLAAKLNAAAGETELTNASCTSRVSSAEGGLYWMNIPYEKGMVCTVDGQEADIEVLFGSLCGVRLDGGEHVVRVTFSAPGAGAGAAVSVLCAAALAAGWFILKRKGKRA